MDSMQAVIAGIDAFTKISQSAKYGDAYDTHRRALLSNTRRMIAELETPLESILWMAWAEPTRTAAIRVGIDLGLFELLSKNSTPCTRQQLANSTSSDPTLLGRVLKHLASMSVIEEVAVDVYKPTQLSNALTIPKYRDAIPFCAEAGGPVFQKIPAFLKEKSYEEPTDPTAGPFQFGHDTTLRAFQWRKERPHIQTAFNNHMAGYHQGRPSWMDDGFYPIEGRILPELKDDPDAVTIVDVGGSIGHDLRELKEKMPKIPGRFILQDLSHVIEQAMDLPTGIEATVHDFWTPQPVKGARIYFMHSVLHDWPDEDCRKLLRHTAAAMEKGYSKLLINENVIPDRGASWEMTSLDWFMMALAAARERTEAQWRELLESAGFRITGIWTKNAASQSVIEAVLK